MAACWPLAKGSRAAGRRPLSVRLAKFPEPPPPTDLAAKVAPDVKTIPAGTTLWRVYFRGGRHPMAWNQFRSDGPVPGGRFDHHGGQPNSQGRAILYAALEGPTCLAEVFQAARVINRYRRDPWMVAFRTMSALDLLDLTGSWPTRAGGSMAINSGPRSRAQRWACAIYQAYPAIHGILYPSSMDANRPALALFERAIARHPDKSTIEPGSRGATSPHPDCKRRCPVRVRNRLTQRGCPKPDRQIERECPIRG